MWTWILEAAKAALTEKVKEMAKEELKEQAQQILDACGVKLDELTDEMAQKIVEWKASMDTETRRATRRVWIIITGIGVLVGLGIGYVL